MLSGCHMEQKETGKSCSYADKIVVIVYVERLQQAPHQTIEAFGT
jgi:hypothetical protein